MSTPVLAHRYRLARTLGRGGMGEVWLAEDAVEGGEVAVKVLTEPLAADAAALLQVKQEFRLMTQLRHPNCCAVYDYGVSEAGSPYFTMEVVPGTGLDACVPMTPDALKPLFVQLLRALAYVHARGFVHCDLKSENVRVRPDGALKLMDFGLMVNAGAAGLPIRGTLGYMPPEVIRREAIDRRSDLYAAGCLAFELLTGGLPFVRPRPMEVLQAHLNEPPPLRGRLADADGLDWAPIVAKLMAKEPLRRYQSADDVLADLGVEAGGGPGVLLAARLVGREAELDALQGRLDAVRRGGAGGAVALVAPPGLGKSRLLDELRVRAQLEHLPFGAGAGRGPDGVPLGPIAAALRMLLPALREAAPALLAAHGPAIAAVVPEVGCAPAPKLDGPDKEKARLFDAVTRLLTGLAAARGLVLALDDWQAADALSVELMAYMRRNAADAPMLVVAASHAPVAGFDEAALAALGADEAGQLLGSMLATAEIPDAFLAKVVDAAEGSPQRLAGALEHLVGTGAMARVDRRWTFPTDWRAEALPANRQALLDRRLATLDDDARALARAAAVLGAPADLADLAAVSALPEERLFAAVERLLEVQVLRHADEHAFALDHPDLAAPLLAGEVAALHARALAMLEARLGATPLAEAPIALVTRLADHADAAGDDARAIRYALEAGKRNTMLFANGPAARLLEAGLARLRAASRMGAAASPAAIPDYARFLADVYRVTGRYDEARALYEEALAAGADALTAGRVRASMAKIHLLQDRLEEALAEAQAARVACAAVGPGPVMVRAMLTAARALLYLGRVAEATAIGDEALAMARSLANSALIGQALALRGALETGAAKPDPALGLALLREARTRFAEAGDRLGLYNAANSLGDALLAAGAYAEARETLEGARRLAFELGSRDDETFAWLNLALADFELGDLPGARAAAERAGALAAELGSRFTAGLATAFAATARAWSGDAGEAAAMFALALAEAAAMRNGYMAGLVRQHQAEALLFLGDAAGALAAAEAWRRLRPEGGEGAARVGATEGAALAALGRDAEAGPVLDAALATAQAAGAHGDEARAHAALARAALRAGRHAAAEPHVAAGLGIAGRIGARLVEAELRGLAGELALAAGRPAAAEFEAMEAAAAGVPALLAAARFGRAAAAPYHPAAADLVRGAQTALEAAGRGLDDEARRGFLAAPERRRIHEGNHIAFSLPAASPARRAPSGPLGFGMGGL